MGDDPLLPSLGSVLIRGGTLPRRDKCKNPYANEGAGVFVAERILRDALATKPVIPGYSKTNAVAMFWL